MQSLALKYLRFSCRYNRIFGLLPIQYNQSTNQLASTDSENDIFRRLFCLVLIIFSILQNMFEAALSVNEGRVMSTLFHGFSLVVKMGKLVSISWILNKPQSVTDLLNTILRSQHSKVKSFRLEQNRSKNKDVELYLFLGILVVSSTTVFYIALPWLPVVIPCLHKPIYQTFHIECSRSAFYQRISGAVLELSVFLAFGQVGPFLAILGYVAIAHLNCALKIYRFQLTNLHTQSAMRVKYFVALYYRRLQITQAICKNCLQDIIFPLAHYGSAFCILTCSFIVITYRDNMNAITVIVLVICAMGFGLISGFLFELGSKPLLMSGAGINTSKRLWGNCAWSKCFFRSCSLIFLKVGFYGKVDRRLFPNLIKMIMYRTIALVVNTRTQRSLEL